MSMDVARVAKNALDACSSIGEIELGGIKLESGDPELLNILSNKLTLDQHVSMQPSAIAYYGMMKKIAARSLAELEREWEKFEKRKMAEARAVVDSLGHKEAKLETVKGRYLVDNELEIKKFEDRFRELAREADTMDAWFEAWKAKGFAIREFVSIDETEKHQTGSINGNGNVERPTNSGAITQTVRDIIRKRRDMAPSQMR